MRAPRTKPERLRALEEIADALHAMCQPLTALQCQLELGQINEDARRASALLNEKNPVGADGLFEGCVQECVRLNSIVTGMREIILRTTEEEQGTNG